MRKMCGMGLYAVNICSLSRHIVEPHITITMLHGDDIIFASVATSHASCASLKDQVTVHVSINVAPLIWNPQVAHWASCTLCQLIYTSSPSWSSAHAPKLHSRKWKERQHKRQRRVSCLFPVSEKTNQQAAFLKKKCRDLIATRSRSLPATTLSM